MVDQIQSPTQEIEEIIRTKGIFISKYDIMTKDKTRHLRSLQKTLHYFLQLNSKKFVAEKDLFRPEKALTDLMAIEHSQDIRVKGPTNSALLTQGFLTDGHVVSLVLENVFRQTLQIAKSNSKIKLVYKIV